MAKVTLEKLNKTFEVNSEEPLMHQLLKNSIPVASSCHGEGICGKCKIKIIDGADNLNPETELESRTKSLNKINANERLCCQLFITAPITIDTSYW